mmetsp:Transcript_17264/g.26639  ORF Transcript_17264/g.26639 Transcript_17264/m.26639 type:complete len:119 (+) Transcript_17264:103-459(+)
MTDDKNIMIQALKDVIAKLAERALKGQISSLISIPTPAYIHVELSHLNMQQNDCTFAPFLTKAAQEPKPLERIKHIVAFVIAGIFPNPTITQCRVPLNPILGETLQREMSTGEKIYCE